MMVARSLSTILTSKELETWITMADLGFGGRVLAGEDSEEDEEEEELDFQFSTTVSAPILRTGPTPKFVVQTPIASNEAEESDEKDADEDEEPPVESVKDPVAVETPRQSLRVSISSSTQSISRPSTPERPPSQSESTSKLNDDSFWNLKQSVNGEAMMSTAIVAKLQPNLDNAIRRIAELTDDQQRLLAVLSRQHKTICSNDEIKNIAIVMGKLPQYIKKVQDIKASIASINATVDRMKKRSENLRVDAQSYAIKKESKRESLNQWNKLYVAKSYEGVTVSTTISSSVVHQPPPPQ